jgi:hypothetical protein
VNPDPSEPIRAPPGVSSDDMIAHLQTEKMLGQISSAVNVGPMGLGQLAQPYLEWLWSVMPGHDWDFKKNGMQYEGFGNYNYMRTGHEGLNIHENLLRRGAGAAQEMTGTGNPAWGNPLQGPPYGDDPHDQKAMPTYRSPPKPRT